ncbi:MAG: hypothetical protein N2A40_04075 [Desulfobulbaceae bacterium]
MGGHMRFSWKTCFLMVAFSLVSCAHGIASQFQNAPQVQESARQGHDGFPDHDGFSSGVDDVLASLTPKERKWYHRFQEGIPLFDGWKKITRAVVEKFPEQEREKRLTAMQALGHKIGHEWSRDNRVRKVSTETLRAWGQDLRKAGSENHVQLANVLHKIESEVNVLLRIE